MSSLAERLAYSLPPTGGAGGPGRQPRHRERCAGTARRSRPPVAHRPTAATATEPSGPDQPRGSRRLRRVRGGHNSEDGRRRQVPKHPEPVSRRRSASSGAGAHRRTQGRRAHRAGQAAWAPPLRRRRRPGRPEEQGPPGAGRRARAPGPADQQRRPRDWITQEISDDILGYGPIEPFLRDSDVSEVMVNGHGHTLLPGEGLAAAGQGAVHRRGPPAPHDREDRRASTGRVDQASPMVYCSGSPTSWL